MSVVRRSLRGALALTSLALLLATGAAHAQSPVWSGSVQGAMTITGNTLGLDSGTDTEPGQSNGIGTFIANPLQYSTERDGSYPVGTTDDWNHNGSSANLTLPTGVPVVRAQLMWACSMQVAGMPDPPMSSPANVTLTLPNGASNVVAATGEVTTLTLATSAYKYYQRWADVTSLVAQGGAGTYTVSKVVGTEHTTTSYLTGCGWTLFVVYQDENELVRNFNIWMTATPVRFTGPGCPCNSEVSVSGFCTPAAPSPVTGRLFVTAMEGDARFVDDSLQIQSPSTVGQFITLKGPNNAASNFFASQINDEDGVLDTSGTFGTSNHSVNLSTGAATFVTGARQGWDITAVPLNDGTYNPGVLSNSQNTTKIRLTTAGGAQGDDYIVTAVAMEVDVKAPAITISHVANRQGTFIGDEITYTVTVRNDGFTTADEVYLCFADPPNAAFNGAVTVAGAARTGVTQTQLNPAGCVGGSGGLSLGSLAVNGTVDVTLGYTVDSLSPAPGPGHTVVSTPSWRSVWRDACAGPADNKISGTGQSVEVPGALLQVTLAADPVTPPNLVFDDVITYTATIANVGAADTPATTVFSLPIPSGATYVAGSTKLNGTAVPDLTGGLPFYASPGRVQSPSAASGVVKVGQAAVVVFQVRVTTTTPQFIEAQAGADVDGGGPAPLQLSNVVRSGVGGSDIDDDGVPDVNDNCPGVYNPDQANHYDVSGYNPAATDEGDVCDDTDGDGLLDSQEDLDGDGWDQGIETDATRVDTDGDMLCDGAITVAPCVGPEDRDGDRSRADWGFTETSPIKSDTDGDGLCDGRLNGATDCRGSEDYDGDGDMTDFDEPADTETNPLAKDTDGGGVEDGVERDAGTNPTDPCEGDLIHCEGPDRDGDGVEDALDNCPDTPNPDQADNYPAPGGNGVGDACDDVDRDGIIDLGEDLGPDGVRGTGDETDPQNPDTDGDGLCDGAIVVAPCIGAEDRDGDRNSADWGSDETSPVNPDTDGDGLCDGLRATATTCVYGEDLDGDHDPTDFDEVGDNETNPLDPDTDHGGVNDGQEFANQTNPRDPCDGDNTFCGQDLALQGGACQGGGAAGGLAALFGLMALLVLRRRSAR